MLEMDDIKKLIGELFLRVYQLEKELEGRKRVPPPPDLPVPANVTDPN